jgi:hypothetical protein
MRRPFSRQLLRLVGFTAVIFSLPAVALALVYADTFASLRQNIAGQILTDALDIPLEVRGPVSASFAWVPRFSLADVIASDAELPADLKGVSIKSIEVNLPLLPLIIGQARPSSLTIDGLKIEISVPKDDAAPHDDDMDVAKAVGEFVRARVAIDLLLRDATIDYGNQENGFVLRSAVHSLASKRTAGGGVAVTGGGHLNGNPWTLDGRVAPPDEASEQRNFAVSVSHTGFKGNVAGSYDLGPAGDTVNMTVAASTPSLTQLLTTYGIAGDLEGSGTLSGKLTGSLEALKLADLVLDVAFETGDQISLLGSVGDVGAGTGLDLGLTGRLVRAPLAEGAQQPLYDIGVTGFNGRIAGSLDGVLVRDVHVLTNSIKANLREFGPITAERLYKDAQGHLGLYDVVVLAGDAARPSVRVAGTVKDIIGLKGIDLKGGIDFQTADFLDLAAEEHAPQLGHLVGDIVISDADGSLGIEALTARVKDTALIELAIDLVFDDIPEGNELKLSTHLNIPKFKPFAAALGSEVEEVGAVRFDGTVTGSDERIVMAGTTVVGQTTLTGSLAGALSQGKPVLSGDISSQLFHLGDFLTLASIRAVYQENVDEKEADVFDYAKVWESLLVELQIKVAKIAGTADASNFAGRVTYLAGIIGLDPLTLTYLGGTASATGKIDTTLADNTFALKGSVDRLPIANVLADLRVNYPVSGLLQVAYDLSGSGNTRAQIPRSLNGSLRLSVHNGWIGTSLLDLAGLSLPAWLLTRTPGGDQATLVCAVAPFSFKDGRGSTHGLVLETSDVQVVGVGYADFQRDQVDLRFKPQALQPQFLKIAQPFAIKGALGSARVTLTGAPLAGAVTDVIAFPFNLLETIIQPTGDALRRIPCHVGRVQ